MKILDDYFDLLEKIYKYFEYDEDWHIYPLDDRTEFPWFVEDDYVYYALNKEKLFGGDDVFCDYLFKGKKGIWVGKEYTAMLVDTQTDGNMFLAIYSNELKQETPPLD